MPQETLCSKCGAPVSGEVVGGFCTACLLEEGLSQADLAQNPIALRYFGDYELIEEIARGGMGVVFKARQRSLNRIVAVKMILSGHLASEAQTQRFRAEARAAAALQHPGIVAIHEVGEHEGLLFFSMDYVAGQNLAQQVRDGPWAATRAAQCVRNIAEAIQYAHEQGVLHRDLKPSNVLIDANGKPHVTDFGLAKQLTSDSRLQTSDLTLTGQILGSPNFMPPEQAAGKHHELTPAADVYSLGAILYHCLTGRPPFVAETLAQTLRMVAEQEAVSPRLLNASVPRDLETICLKCLEKDPRRRYATAQELAAELGRFLRNEPIQARPAGVVLKVHRWCVRNKPLAISGTAILALLLVVAVGSPIAAYRIERERRQAQDNEKKAIEAQSNEIQQRQLADAARANEATLRIKAQGDELAARRRAYAADMLLCQQDLSGNNLRRARLLLERQRPAVGEEDLRGWEWRYLWRRCQGDALVKLNKRGLYGLTAKFIDKDASVMTYVGGGQVGLWHVTAKQEDIIVQDFAANRNFISNSGQLEVSSDGEWTAAAGRSATGESVIRIWETSRRAPIGELDMGNNTVCSLSLSPDKRWLAVFLMNEQLVHAVYDIQTKQRVAEFSTPPHENPGGAVAFSPDGAVLAISGGSSRVRLIRVSNWKEETVLEDFSANDVIALAYSPDGRYLAVGTQFFNPLILIWEIGKNKKTATLSGHRGYITDLSFSPDGKTLASSSADQTIKLWNTETWIGEDTLIGHTDEVRSVAFSSDGRRLVSAGKDGYFCIWPANKKSQDRTSVALPSGLHTPDVSANGKFVVGVAQDRTVRVLELATQRGLDVPGESGRNNVAAFWITDSQILVCSQNPVQLKSLRLADKTSTTYLPGVPENQVVRFNYLPNDHLLALTSVDPATGAVIVKFWDAFSHVEHSSRTFNSKLSSLGEFALSNDGEWIAIFSSDSLPVWNIKTGREKVLSQTDIAFFQGFALLANPPRIVGGSPVTPALTVWDIATGEKMVSLEGHNQILRGIAASPDDERLVTCTIGREPLRIWDTKSWNELLDIEGTEGCSLSVPRFLPDGNTLAALELNLESGARQIRLWRAPSWTEIDAAERDAADKAILYGDNRRSTERANAHARRGRWKEAATDMAKALEVEPSDHTPYHLLAPLLVASGDSDGYRRHCERIQAQFPGTQDPLIAERMAKACLILPGPGVDFQKINQWVKTAMTAHTNDSLFQYAQFVSGLAAYRQTNYTGALEILRQVLSKPVGDPNPHVAAWTVIAMADQGLNQPEEARTTLSNAQELARTKLPKLEAGDLGSFWNDWIITQALLREARTFIEGSPSAIDTFGVKK